MFLIHPLHFSEAEEDFSSSFSLLSGPQIWDTNASDWQLVSRKAFYLAVTFSVSALKGSPHSSQHQNLRRGPCLNDDDDDDDYDRKLCSTANIPTT